MILEVDRRGKVLGLPLYSAFIPLCSLCGGVSEGGYDTSGVP